MWIQFIIQETIVILTVFVSQAGIPAKRKADLEAFIVAGQAVLLDIQAGV
jgi:hypothetical protein